MRKILDWLEDFLEEVSMWGDIVIVECRICRRRVPFDETTRTCARCARVRVTTRGAE